MATVGKMAMQIVIFVLIACPGSDSTYSPFGVKMCKLLCQQTTDCTVFAYSQVHLTCITKEPMAAGDVLLHKLSKKQLSFCQSQSRLVLARDGHDICIKNIPRMKLLVLHSSSKKVTEAFFIDPQTGLRSPYQEIKTSSIYSAAYLSSIRKLVVTRRIHHVYQMDLLSFDSWSTEFLTHHNRLSQRYVTVDDDQQLVFFCYVVRNTQFSVRRINAFTKEESEIMREKGQIRGVTIGIDSTRNRLYVCAFDGIIVISYDGRTKHIVSNDCCPYIGGIVVSDNGNFLYLSNRFDLLKLSVEDESKSNFVRIGTSVKKILILDNNLIMLSAYSFNIHRVDLMQKAIESVANLKMSKHDLSFDICLIK